MIDFLVEPWTYGDWMWRGMLAGALVSVPCAVLGVFLYLRRLSLVADAIAHVALPGIVAAFFLGASLDGPFMLAGAAACGLFASVAIGWLQRRPHVRTDSAIGIVFTTLFAAGVIALTIGVDNVHLDTDCVLFGNILGVSDDTLTMLGITGPLVLLSVALGWRWLATSTFDERFAASIGIPVGAVHYALMAGISIQTVASFEAVGAILVIALIVTPAATAHLLCDRLVSMVGVSVGHAIASTTVGMYISVALDTSSAGAIVVTGAALYLMVFLFAPRHGRLSAAMRRHKPQLGGVQRADTTRPEPAE
jgi:manganese/zinc/iron transport system permease protein